ncbi:MAG: malonyl-CoA synthase [Bauldia sp.]|nr:MAG: malonyl-CoA synthase [Bauldia sp.]
MSENLVSIIADRSPGRERTFLTTLDGRRLSYGEAFDLAGRYANVLSQKGVAVGDRVAVQVEKSPEALVLYLACLRAGAVFLPLNTGYTIGEVEYFIDDARPRLVVSSPGKRDAIAPVAARLGVAAVETLGTENDGSLPRLASEAGTDFATVGRDADDLAAILYTSGTTGRSKGAMLTHANLASNAATLVDCWRFTPADVLLHALPIFHTHGLFVATNVALFSGASMVFLPKFDVAAVRAALPRATCMMGVPTFYTRLLREDWLDRSATAHMRLFVSGSAPLLADTHREWTARTGHRVLERYGMTETSMITSNPYDGERVPGSVGFPLPGVSVRIADPDTGALLPANAIGVIEVKGPNVFKGYWRMPEKTRSEFRADGFFVTGDLGTIDDRGYVSIVGRGKDLVITGGFNVYPKEVEVEIDAIPGVEESAVIGVPHPDFGEGVTALVVRRPGSALGEADVLKALDGRLARFKLPKRVLFVGSLPRNTMGKVLKGDLRKEYAALYEPAS